MDSYTIPQNPPSSSFLPSNYDNDDKPDQSATPFMKAPKRKRLAKAYLLLAFLITFFNFLLGL